MIGGIVNVWTSSSICSSFELLKVSVAKHTCLIRLQTEFLQHQWYSQLEYNYEEDRIASYNFFSFFPYYYIFLERKWIADSCRETKQIFEVLKDYFASFVNILQFQCFLFLETETILNKFIVTLYHPN